MYGSLVLLALFYKQLIKFSCFYFVNLRFVADLIIGVDLEVLELFEINLLKVEFRCKMVLSSAYEDDEG